jgi:hypothetical protein
MDWLYVLAQPFVWHPGRALLVASGLLLCALLIRSGRRPLLLATAAWILFAGQEFTAWRGRSDIRVDLLITWPILCFFTAACLGVALKRMFARAVQ